MKIFSPKCDVMHQLYTAIVCANFKCTGPGIYGGHFLFILKLIINSYTRNKKIRTVGDVWKSEEEIHKLSQISTRFSREIGDSLGSTFKCS